MASGVRVPRTTGSDWMVTVTLGQLVVDVVAVVDDVDDVDDEDEEGDEELPLVGQGIHPLEFTLIDPPGGVDEGDTETSEGVVVEVDDELDEPGRVVDVLLDEEEVDELVEEDEELELLDEDDELDDDELLELLDELLLEEDDELLDDEEDPDPAYWMS